MSAEQHVDLQDLRIKFPVIDALESQDRKAGLPESEVCRNKANRTKAIIDSGDYPLYRILTNTLELIKSRNGSGNPQEKKDFCNFYLSVRGSMPQDKRREFDALLPEFGIELPSSKILKWAKKNGILDNEGHPVPYAFFPNRVLPVLRQ